MVTVVNASLLFESQCVRGERRGRDTGEREEREEERKQREGGREERMQEFNLVGLS